MNKISKLKRFLQENYPNEQAFDCANWCGDSVRKVYNEDGIEVDYCYGYGYLEIFGLSNEEFQDLLDPESFLGAHLRTFTEEEMA